MYRYVFVSLLKTSVFLNKVQIISSDDNSPLHLHLLDNSCKDSASDVDWSGEWTFFVDVGSEDCLNTDHEILSSYIRMRVSYHYTSKCLSAADTCSMDVGFIYQ